MKTAFNYTLEILDENQDIQLEVHYDLGAVIGSIFVYQPHLDEMVKLDVDAFENMHPTRFAKIQFDVNALAEEIQRSQQEE